MKRYIYIAILLAGCLLVAMPAVAGNIYLTGHDLDFHCALQIDTAPAACNAFKIAFNLARAGAPDPTKPVLFLDQGCLVSLGESCTGSGETQMAATNAGIPATSYTVVDPTSSGFLTMALTTSNYSAIVFASDTTCIGCDNTSLGEMAINNRSTDIQNFFNAGGGLVYLAGANSGIYYNSVPAGFKVQPTATLPGVPPEGCLTSPTAGCYSLTPIGTALGLTNDDANCCATHNSFVPSFNGVEGHGGSSALLLVAELDGSESPNDETLFATSSAAVFTFPAGSAAVLTFPAGNNSSAIGTFNCPSGQTPCPDADAHSMKFTVGTVSSSFSIVLTATEVTGDGVCETGIPDDPTSIDIDCRFVRFFGEPAFTGYFVSTKVPLCYPYSHGKCVVYSVVGAPPPPNLGGPYSGGVQEKIAWNNVFTAPTGYVNSPRMYDDPSNDFDGTNYPPISDPINGNVFPYVSPQVEDLQFVFDITTFFNPSPNTVGTDPTTSGRGNTFNDFAIAWPFTLAQVQQPINSDGSSVFNAKRGVIPVKFTYFVDGAATCNLPTATISLTQLSGAAPGSVDENTYLNLADSGSIFRISGCQYIYNLDVRSLGGVGTYVVRISINSKVVGSAFFELK